MNVRKKRKAGEHVHLGLNDHGRSIALQHSMIMQKQKQFLEMKERKKSGENEEDEKDSWTEEAKEFSELVDHFQKRQKDFYDKGCPTGNTKEYEIYTKPFNFHKYKLFLDPRNQPIRSFEDYIRHQALSS